MIAPVVIREGGALQIVQLGAVISHIKGEIDLVADPRRLKNLGRNREYYDANRDEINARRREQYANAPEYRARRNAANSARQRERYATDAEYREQVLARQRAPAFREWQNARTADRRANDPDYREKRNAAHRDAVRERCANDPEYRAKANARRKASRAAARAQRPPAVPSPEEAEVAAFVAWSVREQGLGESVAVYRRAALRAYFRFLSEREAIA